jgi:hypothetical protein
MGVKWTAISQRTGIEGFYVVVRGSTEDLNEPKMYFSSKAESFVKEVLHLEPHHLGLKLEAWVVSGLAGAGSSVCLQTCYANDTSSQIILSDLQVERSGH